MHRPGGLFPVRFPFPVNVPCTSPCLARFDHLGRVSARTSISNTASAQEQATWRVNGGAPLISQSATQNGAYDRQLTATVWSFTGSTNTVDASGSVTIPSTSGFASAFVANGYAQAIRGQLSCPSIPAVGIGRVSDYGTTQGGSQPLSLYLSIWSFLY
ncbi:hypothetical protein HMI49_09510 [Corallococcus exercitus]|uniref:Uncharacterized protein n=1 Tax=Corallococcus exercitus TaxID=2316736 RepID=A0A7Y4KGW9_9BACT|nr:hypothetical protein [Corallococcus exercitus]NOK33432.1 hypothetical protein [Corallococcus exercitus]